MILPQKKTADGEDSGKKTEMMMVHSRKIRHFSMQKKYLKVKIARKIYNFKITFHTLGSTKHTKKHPPAHHPPDNAKEIRKESKKKKSSRK